MSETKPIARLAELRRDWGRWMRAVAACNADAARRPKISAPEYSSLQQTLLKACDRCAAEADETKRQIIQRMAGVVEPWVSLDSLTHANKKVLEEVLEMSRSLDQQLSGRCTPARTAAYTGYMIASVMTASLLAVIIDLWREAKLLPRVTTEARILYYTFASSLEQATFMTKFSLITVIVVLIGVWLMSNTRRY